MATPTLISTTDKEVISINRRRLLITATLLPIALLPYNEKANAVLPIFWGIARIFASNWLRRSMLRTVAKKSIEKIRPSTKIARTKSKEITSTAYDGYKLHHAAGHAIDLSKLILDTRWGSQDKKESTLVINNNDKDKHNTGEIVVQLKDKSDSGIDVTATIEPIDIPASSRLVLAVKMDSPPRAGIKNLGGYYGVNEKHKIEKSGNIIIPKRGDSRNLDDMIKEFEKKGYRSHT